MNTLINKLSRAVSRPFSNWLQTDDDIRQLRRKAKIYNYLFKEAEKIVHLGHWQWDIKTNKVMWSQNMFRIFGFQKNSDYVNFEQFISGIHPNDKDHVLQCIQQALVTKEFKEFHHRIVKPDGEVRILAARGTVVLGKKGQVLQMIGTGQDITEIKLAEQELIQKSRELEQRNADLQTFAYLASHDLQEPLRKMVLYGSLLQEEQGKNISEPGKKYLQKMIDSSRRMRQLITHVLQLSSFPSKIDFRPVKLEHIVMRVLDDIESLINDTDAMFDMGALPEIEVDEISLRQVFQNLFINCIKFRKPGLAPRISIYGKIFHKKDAQSLRTASYRPILGTDLLELDRWYCEIVIEDNGTGFDQSLKDHIFQPFQTAHSRSVYPGSGIGLSIVKKIVELHRGWLDVQSKPDEGTKFYIYLPAQQNTVAAAKT